MCLESVCVFGSVKASLGDGALGCWSFTFLSRLLLLLVSSAGGFVGMYSSNIHWGSNT